ncbi:MAG: MoxR family ATPase, partial [bacterium]|nr:MoxR family ATPase [bacterium]
DEINRSPAKVQSALLEAMQEHQVTLAKQSLALPEPFMVLATQNPIEQEGTYPLPEAQMDRFLMKVRITYPDPASEVQVLRLVRGEEITRAIATGGDDEQPIAQQTVFEARREIHAVHVSENIERYIIDLINATRLPKPYGEPLSKWLQVGASPRGGIGLEKTGRAQAWLDGRDYVTPDDIRATIYDVLRHRLILTYEANADNVTMDQVIDEIVKSVAVA